MNTLLLISVLLGSTIILDHVYGRTVSRSQKLSTIFDEAKEHQRDIGYLEQCSIIDFWEEQLGFVNVLAFFDSSWLLSHRQAALLNILKTRFEKSGLPDVRFFLINVAKSAAELDQESETETEKETWKHIWPEEIEENVPVDKSVEGLAEAAGSGIFFIQDTPHLQMWERLHASRDQIMILDRCGKLAYQVIVPWSILHFPYVKAAILSTYNDEPCGPCNLQFNSLDEHESNIANVVEDELDSAENEQFMSYNIQSTTEASEIVGTTDENISVTVIEDGNVITTEYSSMSDETSEDFTVSVIDDTTYEERVTEEQNLTTSNFEFYTTDNTLKDINYEQTTHETTDTNILNAKELEKDHSNYSLKIHSSIRKDKENEEEVTTDSILPIRIIMRAPHYHNKLPLKKHEYLILKTGHPRYHGHIDGDNKIHFDNQEIITESKNADERDIDESGVHILDKPFVTNFDKDESPGFYGEVSDYWRNFGNKDNFEDEEHTTNDSEESTNYGSIEDQNYTDENISDDEFMVTESSEVEIQEGEEAKSKLIAHYSKLLPWIYYVLKR